MKTYYKDFIELSEWEQKHIKDKILLVCRTFMKTCSYPLSAQKTYRALMYDKKIIKHCLADEELRKEVRENHRKTTAFKKTTFVTIGSFT